MNSENQRTALSPLKFIPITHQNMSLIWEFLQREPGRTTDFSYGGVLMWVELFHYEYAIFNNTLFIKGLVENDLSKTAFSLPIGDLSLEASIKVLMDYCNIEGFQLELSAVPEYALPSLQSLYPVTIELLGDWSDYLYDASMLANLSGKKMSKKRNHVNSFIAHFPDWQFEPLTRLNAPMALEFMKIYDNEADDSFMAREESHLTKKIIKILEVGDDILLGGILYNQPGQICALTIGDIKGDTLFIHIEKADKLIPGSYEMINKLFASSILASHPEIKFINREDDAGDEGLRKAKTSYHPIQLLKKYNVIF